MEAKSAEAPQQTAKDFQSNQEVRWCPGCGDYSILAQVQRTLPELGIPRERYVVVGGIGCSSRFPYYMNTYGVHTIHGRAPAVATGIKAANPDLNVWVITGDGDGLSIGGNHLLHVLRRNVDLRILLFNNRIYGLTKGQYSPTSTEGTRSGSTPFGSIDRPLDPVRFALGSNATFVARTVDVDAPHFKEVLKRAATHKGAAFIEILQNCPIFNDGAFIQVQEKKTRPAHALYLENGKPLVFGEKKELGIALDQSMQPRLVAADDPAVLIHDEKNAMIANAIALLATIPGMPTPLGIFHAIERPTYEAALVEQVERQKSAKPTSLQKLLESGETWRVG